MNITPYVKNVSINGVPIKYKTRHNINGISTIISPFGNIEIKGQFCKADPNRIIPDKGKPIIELSLQNTN